MELLKSEISYFKNITETEVVRSPYSLSDCINEIRTGKYKEVVVKIRSGKEELKKQIPAIAVHGIFRDYRQSKDFILSSGIIIIDIDDSEDNLEELKQDIMDSFNYVFAVMVGPSGNGLKVLCHVDPDLVTSENYREIGKFLSKDFSVYGSIDYLSVTDCLIMTYDPLILVNEECVPASVYLKEVTTQKVELEKLDKNKKLWEDAEEFYQIVLSENIEQKSSNNYHYLQMAMLDLSKYGFNHPKDDLSFVIDYAEAVHKRSGENKTRFLELVEICKKYPQQLWPYKTSREDTDFEDEEPEYDYSEYTTKGKVENESLEKDEESDTEGMIDYSNFEERVLTVAREGNRVGAEISLKSFADIFRFRGSGILTITGIPGHGKTEWIDQCILDLARLYNQETLVAGYEQSPEEHVIKLVRRMSGKDVTCKTYLSEKNLPEFRKHLNFVTSKIKHIDTTKEGGEITNLLKIAARQIQKSRESGPGIRYLVIDPYNMLSLKGTRLNGFEKVEEILRKITHFSHQMDVLVILVAHPVKIKKDEKTKLYEVPDFYSVKGSSAFFEMSFHGLVVYRMGYNSSDLVLVRVLKVKQRNLGKTMEEASFTYETNSGRYIPVDDEGVELEGDHRDMDWLERYEKTFLK